MTIESLSLTDQATLATTYQKRTLAQLRSLAQVMGIDSTGTKAQLIARLVGNALKANVPAPAPFDMSGLVIRCAPGAFNS